MSRVHGEGQGIQTLVRCPDAGRCRADALSHATLACHINEFHGSYESNGRFNCLGGMAGWNAWKHRTQQKVFLLSRHFNRTNYKKGAKG